MPALWIHVQIWDVNNASKSPNFERSCQCIKAHIVQSKRGSVCLGSSQRARYACKVLHLHDALSTFYKSVPACINPVCLYLQHAGVSAASGPCVYKRRNYHSQWLHLKKPVNRMKCSQPA